MKLYAYGCEKPLKLRGKVLCSIDYEGRSVLTDIYVVVNRSSGCLLGKDTAESLGVLKLVDSIVQGTYDGGMWDKQTVAEKFPTIVQGVGRLKDTQVSIRVDKKVKPIKQAYRRIPYHLTSKLERRLKRV